jgi:uncharacterized protein YeaO (DUF488 family)
MRQARRLRGPRLRTKRAYEAAARSDGYRVLVDRLWPRGVKKDALALDAWAKDLAPSSELRRWFGHAPSRWKKFVERYRLELRAPAARERLDDLTRRAAKGACHRRLRRPLEQHNDAAVVRGEIARRLRRRPVRSARHGAA